MDASFPPFPSGNAASVQRVRSWLAQGGVASAEQARRAAIQGTRDAFTQAGAAPSAPGGNGGVQTSAVSAARPLGFEAQRSLQDEVRAALLRRTPPDENGKLAIPYMTENATGGWAARDGGRAFGMEIEFFLPAENKAEALRAIAEELHTVGLTPVAHQVSHTHSTKPAQLEHERGWRFEKECYGVDGELVSPVCFDEPETWKNLAKAIEIIRRHGGDVNVSTGGHVHVGTGDFGDDVAPTNAVLKITKEFENELYLFASEPMRGTHRGTMFCRPNLTPAEGYASITDARRSASSGWSGMTSARNSVVNLSHLSGQETDHLEIRQWDSSLREEVIQVHVKTSIALIEAGKRLAAREGGFADVELSPSRASGMDLDSLEGRVARFTELFDLLFERDEDKRQAVALLASIDFPRAEA